MRRVLIVAALVLASCVSEGQPNRTFSISIGSPTPSVAPVAPSPSGTSASASPAAVTLKEFAVPGGSGPHDVAPAADGGVWFTAQRSGQLGWLDPKTGLTKMIPLGAGSAPHGVIVGPDAAPWITDGGLNAIVRVDPRTSEVTRYALPAGTPRIDMNTAAFGTDGLLYFTGQGGYYGRLDPRQRGGGDRPPTADVKQAPRGAGPYGITVVSSLAPGIFYASLAGDHIAEVTFVPTDASPTSGYGAYPIDPPTRGAGPRRVWSDSKGNVWVSEWNAGQVGRYEPKTRIWKEWKLPNSARPQAYAVFVDDQDIVWLSEWSSSSIVRFDPKTETFTSYPHAPNGGVRQLHGRPGEVWGALSALDRLLLITTR